MDVVSRIGGSTVDSNWTGGGNTTSNTTYAGGCNATYPSGACTATYRAPTDNDLGLWPQVFVQKAPRQRVTVDYANGGLATVTTGFGPNCGYVEPDEYDANSYGFPETGSIKATATVPLAATKKGKTITKTITASSADSCDSASACSPELQQTDNQNASLNFTHECTTSQKWAGTPPIGPAIACSSHDSYTGKLTFRYVK
jgi:hypothetical protein